MTGSLIPQICHFRWKLLCWVPALVASCLFSICERAGDGRFEPRTHLPLTLGGMQDQGAALLPIFFFWDHGQLQSRLPGLPCIPLRIQQTILNFKRFWVQILVPSKEKKSRLLLWPKFICTIHWQTQINISPNKLCLGRTRKEALTFLMQLTFSSSFIQPCIYLFIVSTEYLIHTRKLG
jgi:hypothetical protein